MLRKKEADYLRMVGAMRRLVGMDVVVYLEKAEVRGVLFRVTEAQFVVSETQADPRCKTTHLVETRHVQACGVEVDEALGFRVLVFLK